MIFYKTTVDILNKSFTKFYAIYNSINNTWHDKNKRVLISGLPRGGTTWLAEVLSSSPKTILIWEPLRRFRLYEQNLHDFSNKIGWFPYIPINDSWKKGRETVDNIFSLQELNYKSLLKHNPYKKVLNSDFAVIKCVTANGLLPYFNEHVDMRTILLIRHPCAVVLSQLNHPSFGSAHKEAEKFFDSKFVHSNRFAQYKKIYNELKTIEELLSFIWCMQHIIPFESSKSNLRLVVFYEELLIHPEKEFPRIFKFTNRYISNYLELIKNPSHTIVDFNTNNTKQVEKWKEKLNKKQIENILSVLNKLGMDIYNEDIYPNKQSIWYQDNKAI